jgi:hypothetical protein
MEKNRRIVGAAAGCAVVVATLLGAPSAKAEGDSITCGDSQSAAAVRGPGPSQNAFNKVCALGFPGNTFDVFFKYR